MSWESFDRPALARPERGTVRTVAVCAGCEEAITRDKLDGWLHAATNQPGCAL